MAIILPEHPLPPKPRQGEACNGCGLCCHVELCLAGVLAFPEAEAPCPGLLFANGRTYCKLVLAEQTNPALDPLIQRGLGIGLGCSMPDDCVP